MTRARELRRWLEVRFKDRRGVAAVEFAFILPLLIALYFGAIEISQAVMADRKVTNITSTVADLVAQTKTVNDNELQDIFEAATAILVPFPTTGLTIVLSSVVVDVDGKPTVDWSKAGPYGGTARSQGSPFTLPDGLNIPSTSLIVAEVQYDYVSFLKYLVPSGITLTDTFYLRPRVTDKVKKV
ncbi:MAG TPA: pilus assembly protein [Hyphomicrobiales bacterium]|nr:pilus assembly protein [Rhodobiaceae bacterium]HXK53226.1 pilus assembly protein [Hyphomicrobiales bacterium]